MATQQTYQAWARAVRADHDDGSSAFFDPALAHWTETLVEPADLGVFDSPEEARQWLDDEITLLEADGNESAAEAYRRMLTEHIEEPVIVSRRENTFRLWDGYHRTAVALIRGERLPALVGTPFPTPA
jgi:hypothetical protein